MMMFFTVVKVFAAWNIAYLRGRIKELGIIQSASLDFSNDSKDTEMSVDVTIQIASELQRQIKTYVWQLRRKETDGVQHQI
ncbi:hypothetical protein TNCV_1597501 [Trichonephila clavipes]|nr:hypothetical protein TNCV_1597501 [Trichonephila clavipes]